MIPKKSHFILLAIVALLLVLFAGYQLKFQTPDSRAATLGWGFVFMAGTIFFIRAMLLINKLKG